MQFNLASSKNLYRTNYFFISLDKKSAFDMQVYEIYKLKFWSKHLCNSKWRSSNLYNSKFSIHTQCISKNLDLQDK